MNKHQFQGLMGIPSTNWPSPCGLESHWNSLLVVSSIHLVSACGYFGNPLYVPIILGYMPSILAIPLESPETIINHLPILVSGNLGCLWLSYVFGNPTNELQWFTGMEHLSLGRWANQVVLLAMHGYAACPMIANSLF